MPFFRLDIALKIVEWLESGNAWEDVKDFFRNLMDYISGVFND